MRLRKFNQFHFLLSCATELLLFKLQFNSCHIVLYCRHVCSWCCKSHFILLTRPTPIYSHPNQQGISWFPFYQLPILDQYCIYQLNIRPSAVARPTLNHSDALTDLNYTQFFSRFFLLLSAFTRASVEVVQRNAHDLLRTNLSTSDQGNYHAVMFCIKIQPELIFEQFHLRWLLSP